MYIYIYIYIYIYTSDVHLRRPRRCVFCTYISKHKHKYNPTGQFLPVDHHGSLPPCALARVFFSLLRSSRILRHKQQRVNPTSERSV